MSIFKDINKLLEAEVITQETADEITNYYKQQHSKPSNNLFIIFGVLGSILVGLGIILMVAHNWDELSRITKTIFSFIPLIIGQLACFYSILKKNNSIAWRESSAVFLFFAVGAVISLVSQIYNISGNLSGYLFTWMILCLPLIYIMRSSIVSLLYIAGISAYVVSVSIDENFLGLKVNEDWLSKNFFEHYSYLLMLLSIIPYYYKLIKNKPSSNFTAFHNWFIPISFMIGLATFSNSFEYFAFVSYMSLFSLFYMIGNSDTFKSKRILSNSYLIIALIGIIYTLLILSFNSGTINLYAGVFAASSFYFAIIISALASVLFVKQELKKDFKEISIMSYVFAIYLIIFCVNIWLPIRHILVDILIFIIGILNIVKGVKKSHLGITNYGLIVIILLVICRFFDTNFSFIIRGILFLTVGLGFFVINYKMLKDRNQ